MNATTNTETRGYEDSTEHLLAEFERTARILDGYRTTLEKRAGPSRPTTPTDVVAPEEPVSLPLAIPEDIRHEARMQAREITATVETTLDAGTTLRLRHLVETFGLGAHHRDVLLLALLPTAYPHYQEVFAELQNDLSATQPTVGLIADLFSETDAQFLAATRLVGPESPLLAHDLVTLGEPDEKRLHRTERPVFVEERIESYLLGHEGIDPLLENVIEEVPAETTLEELRLDDDLADRLADIAIDSGDEMGRRFYWHGSPGTEKGRSVEAVTPTPRLLRGDLTTVIETNALDRVCREAMLLDLPLHLHGVSKATDDREGTGFTVDAVLERFEPFQCDLLLTGDEEWTPDRSSTASVDAIVHFPRPEFDIRKEFWADHRDVLPDDVEPSVLAGIFELTQGELETALATARSLAGSETLDSKHIHEGCSTQSANKLGDLAEELDPSSNWGDIELPENTMRGLRTVASHVTHKGRIYAEWAFEERFSRGNGVVAMFTGPSGTGKTMAAEIIANDVGMKLYKIDLSSVVSKYIGETEENLEEIFTEAEHSNAILLFDEADAVFGDRAGVSDATDRYANVEVNYLLQRIESYNGVVLLTTNYESNIDSAFMRRIDHSITFNRPREETRRAIWDGIFPDATPVEGLDYEFLSSFKLTGGNIRTVAQTAALLAAADEGTVEMKHVVRGLQRELEKNGKMVDPQEFREYREHLYM